MTIEQSLPFGPGILPSEYVALGWCQGASALNSAGYEVSARNPNAVQVCGAGAMVRWGRFVSQELYQASVQARRTDFIPWQDDPARTKEEVIAELERVEHLLGLCKKV